MPALPSGTVTFLFTDIEGSTRLLGALGSEDYARVLADHRRVLREAFTRHGGVEVDSVGDAVFAAFPTAPGAIAAAREATEALTSTPVHVRIGIHTGTPLITADGYIGDDVHRAARISRVAHGGQVLVSASTAALIDAAGLQDLGTHRLKDIAGSLQLYQLGDQSFSPVMTLYRTNVPVPLTRFIGRHAEIADIVNLLTRDDRRLVTLVGPGGVAKTRLAIEAAGLAGEHFPDGVSWVPLGAVRDADSVSSSLADALEIREVPGEPLIRTLAARLAGTRSLVVVDRGEHLLAAVAGSLRPLLEVDGPCFLVTSRERLGQVGEHVWRVSPMLPSEGEALFLASARALDHRFVWTPAAAQLCARLEQLPLSLELAAARTALLSPEQLLERLSQRLDLLRTSGDSESQHQTLRATIGWSFDLLGSEEQRLFEGLSVFAGECTLSAAEAVCSATPDTLQSLIDKSLVNRDPFNGSPRYSMLDTVREFARESLVASGVAEAARGRHARYFAALAGVVVPSPGPGLPIGRSSRRDCGAGRRLARGARQLPGRARLPCPKRRVRLGAGARCIAVQPLDHGGVGGGGPDRRRGGPRSGLGSSA